ncbi:glycosyl hydrolase family 38 protein [Senna tora]|uniref:Glycosyl hydrolase family 38 protein n=1 Tax=Senna tora TaxID=362788 RepID=A0A834SX49_9FABA|nr:glycosyl hydrolase family 38 protein [Senna tora]
MHLLTRMPIPVTVIFGQLFTFKIFKLKSAASPDISSNAASVTSSQQPMSRASRLLHWLRMQLNEESEMFRHQSIRKCLRLLLQEVASNFIALSETSRHPPMIKPDAIFVGQDSPWQQMINPCLSAFCSRIHPMTAILKDPHQLQPFQHL